MARKRATGGPNRSQFIRDLFGANPKAKLGDAKKAWAEAGHKGELSNSLFYVTKRNLGLTGSGGGKRRGRPPGSKNKSVTSTAGSARKSVAGYEAVEDRLDDVIRMLWELGDHAMVAELRTVRRQIAAKLV